MSVTPHTIYHLARKEHLMTESERAELLAEGWQSLIVQELADRGFRPCKPDIVSARFEGTDNTTCGFLRQTCMPHIYITIRRDEFIEVVREQIDTAIFDAGWSAGGDHIATLFQRFQDAVKRPRRPTEDERSIQELRDLVKTWIKGQQGTEN